MARSLGAAAEPEMVAQGLGGRLILYRDKVVIKRTGVLHVLMDLLRPHMPRVDTTIFLHQITSINIVRPMLLIEFLRITYAGEDAAVITNYWGSAFAHNTVLMNLFDNRPFFALLARLEELRTAACSAGPRA
jgi:hypothetical protein